MENIKLGRVKKRKIDFKTIGKRLRNSFIIFTLILLTVLYGKGIFRDVKSILESSRVVASDGFLIPNALSNLESTNVKADVLGTSVTPVKNVTANLGSKDLRAFVFDEYFRANNSPLYGTGELFVKYCDQAGGPKDCIIAVAIARNESNLCKYPGSAEMFNCWGFGGGGEYRLKFNSYEESIERVTNSLVHSYGREYIENPSLMETVFCGSEPGCKGWGNGIKYFVNQIDQFSIDLGAGSLLALRNS